MANVTEESIQLGNAVSFRDCHGVKHSDTLTDMVPNIELRVLYMDPWAAGRDYELGLGS